MEQDFWKFCIPHFAEQKMEKYTENLFQAQDSFHNHQLVNRNNESDFGDLQFRRGAVQGNH